MGGREVLVNTRTTFPFSLTTAFTLSDHKLRREQQTSTCNTINVPPRTVANDGPEGRYNTEDLPLLPGGWPSALSDSFSALNDYMPTAVVAQQCHAPLGCTSSNFPPAMLGQADGIHSVDVTKQVLGLNSGNTANALADKLHNLYVVRNGFLKLPKMACVDATLETLPDTFEFPPVAFHTPPLSIPKPDDFLRKNFFVNINTQRSVTASNCVTNLDCAPKCSSANFNVSDAKPLHTAHQEGNSAGKRTGVEYEEPFIAARPYRQEDIEYALLLSHFSSTAINGATSTGDNSQEVIQTFRGRESTTFKTHRTMKAMAGKRKSCSRGKK